MPRPKENRHIPTQLTENQFNQFVLKHLPKRHRGPITKIPSFRIFNYILKFLYTGCQWKELPIRLDSTGTPEIHYTRIFRIFKYWIRHDVFVKIFEHSVIILKKFGLLDTSILHGDGTTTIAKKGGDNIGYSGHKHLRGDKIVAFCDRLCNVIAPFITAPGNRHESKLFPESFAHLKRMAKKVGISLKKCIASLDSAYDNRATRRKIMNAGMKPNIKENLRNRKKKKRGRKKRYDDDIFKERFETIERVFAWEDKFKRLLLRFERLSIHHFSLKMLAYTLINLRHFCG